VEEQWFTAKGVVGFWPSNAVGDDIAVYADGTRTTEIARFHTLRQQIRKSNGKPNLAMSDFVAEDGQDYIGAFAVTAGHGELEVAKRFKDAGDDYSSILATSLADRLAELVELHCGRPALCVYGVHRARHLGSTQVFQTGILCDDIR
jgi:5-methyltetrahydrofolate--homocysteine methyltransferase